MADTKISIPKRPTKSLVPENNEQVIESKWEQTCEDFRLRLKEVNKNLVQVYYDIGLQVLNITTYPGSWGTHTAEEFGKRLSISKNSVAAAARFAQMITPFELNILIKNNITWSAAVALIVVRDPGTRHILCDNYCKYGWTTEQLRLEINKLLPPELQDAPGKHGGVNPAICFKKVASQAAELGSNIPEYLEFFSSYAKLEEKDRSEKAVEAYHMSIKNLTALRNVVDEVLSKLNENNKNTRKVTTK